MTDKRIDRKWGARYEEIQRNECLRDLGYAIYVMRNLKSVISLDVAREMPVERLIEALDASYQKSLTDILDALVGCRDMHLARAAIDGIRKSLDQDRGLGGKKIAIRPEDG